MARSPQGLKNEFSNGYSILEEIDKINLKVPTTSKSEISIRRLQNIPDKLKNIWKRNKVYLFRQEVIYKFKIEFDFEFVIDSNLEGLGIDSKEFYLTSVLPQATEKRFYEFLMILNLSRIYSFQYGLGFIDDKRGINKLKSMSFYPDSYYDYAVEKKWPTFENLNVYNTWDWFLEKVDADNISGISSSKISRAFNAFTYLYNNSNDANALFWTMMGLEALYVSGKEGITEQIKQKGQLYLGEIIEFKKRLNSMYDFRSSFIHGSKNFPSYFNYDELDETESFFDNLYDNLITAQSMLLATLQKMAKENRSELKFEYIVS